MVAPKRAKRTILRLALRAKLSLRGFADVFPSVLSRENMGDSFIFRRMMMETTTNRMDTKKGIRHPHALNLAMEVAGSLSSICRVPRIMPSDRRRPKVAVVWIHDVKNPRR